MIIELVLGACFLYCPTIENLKIKNNDNYLSYVSDNKKSLNKKQYIKLPTNWKIINFNKI